MRISPSRDPSERSSFGMTAFATLEHLAIPKFRAMAVGALTNPPRAATLAEHAGRGERPGHCTSRKGKGVDHARSASGGGLGRGPEGRPGEHQAGERGVPGEL